MRVLWLAIKRQLYLFVAAGALLTLATTIVWLAINGNIKSSDNNLSDFLKTVGALTIIVAIFGPWAVWIYWPYKTAHKPKEKEIARGVSWLRAKKTGGVLLIAGAVTLFVFGGYRVFRKMTSNQFSTAAGSGASKSAETRPGVVSRVTSRTIIAKPGEWSSRVSVPFGQIGCNRPQGKVRVLTASGKTWDDWPGRPGVIRNDVPPEDAMFQFMSLENKEVEVIVEWQPR